MVRGLISSQLLCKFSRKVQSNLLSNRAAGAAHSTRNGFLFRKTGRSLSHPWSSTRLWSKNNDASFRATDLAKCPNIQRSQIHTWIHSAHFRFSMIRMRNDHRSITIPFGGPLPDGDPLQGFCNALVFLAMTHRTPTRPTRLWDVLFPVGSRSGNPRHSHTHTTSEGGFGSLHFHLVTIERH